MKKAKKKSTKKAAAKKAPARAKRATKKPAPPPAPAPKPPARAKARKASRTRVRAEPPPPPAPPPVPPAPPTPEPTQSPQDLWPDPPSRSIPAERVDAALAAEQPASWAKLAPAQRRFLAAFGVCGLNTRAAEAAGISVGQEWRWRTEGQPGYSAAYAAAYAEAQHLLTAVLYDAAVDRAIHGTDKPIVHEGMVTGYVREVDNGMLQRLLRARMPEHFTERQQVRHEADQPLVTVIDLSHGRTPPTPTTPPRPDGRAA